jgi:hypothetical protein
MVKNNKGKCIICGLKPATTGYYCHNCKAKLSTYAGRLPEKPHYYLVYKEHVVGLYTNQRGRLSPRLLRRNAEKLPKSNTINLNNFCQGYDRATIKRMKRCVLQCAEPITAIKAR